MKRYVFAAALAVAAFGLTGQVQQPQKPFRITSSVSEVALPVTFLDPAGDFISNVQRSDVTLLDNRAPQTIQTFEVAYRPISLVIVVDTGKRMIGVLDGLRTSGVLFTQLVMGETGEAAFLTYDYTFELKQNFTTNGNLIEKQFKDLAVGEAGSNLTSAVARAIGMLSNRPEGRRKVVVILGEGRDYGSESNMNRVLMEAQLNNISIFAVELSAFKGIVKRPIPGTNHENDNVPPGNTPQRAGRPAVTDSPAMGFDLLTPLFEGAMAVRGLWAHPMKTYASGTGSNHLNATNRKALEEAVQRIGSELHTQYWVSYKPDNLAAQEFHTIEVKVNQPGIKARHRPGYLYIPADAQDANK